MTVMDVKLRAGIDAVVKPRMAAQEAYMAYGKTSFALENADLLYVLDQYRQQYLDFSSGDNVMPLGHGSGAVRSRVAEQMAHYGYVGSPQSFVQRWPVEYAQRLSQSLPNSVEEPQQVLFTTDEDTAMTLATTMAQKATGRVTLTQRLDWPLGYTDTAALVVRVINQHDRLARPADVNDGITQARMGGALVIADERRVGYGRTGKLWGQERWEYRPDITVLGGAGGGGFPFGAVVAPRALFSASSDWLDRSRTAGHPAICAAGMQTLVALDAPLMDHVTDAGAVLNAALDELVTQFPEIIAEHSGVGLMHHVWTHTYDDAEKLFFKCREAGLLTGRCHNKSVELTPPLITSELEIRRGADLLAGACMEWDS